MLPGRLLDRSLSRFPPPVRTALDWVVTVTVAVVVVLAFQAEVAKPYRIPTASMEPTLHCAAPTAGCRAQFADRVIANRLAYRFRSPERGEIVVFRAPARAAQACNGGGDYVKRIVGLPGETITMRRGHVLVDGRPLDESTYVRTPAQRGDQTGSWHVPAARYLLLGDNRPASCDSRAFGPVARDALVGPVEARYWPPRRIDAVG